MACRQQIFQNYVCSVKREMNAAAYCEDQEPGCYTQTVAISLWCNKSVLRFFRYTEKDISMQKFSALLALASISLTLNPCLLEAQSSASAATTTPIKHLVVIFDENISFDHSHFAPISMPATRRENPVSMRLHNSRL